jgi:hypothetical protein
MVRRKDKQWTYPPDVSVDFYENEIADYLASELEGEPDFNLDEETLPLWLKEDLELGGRQDRDLEEDVVQAMREAGLAVILNYAKSIPVEERFACKGFCDHLCHQAAEKSDRHPKQTSKIWREALERLHRKFPSAASEAERARRDEYFKKLENAYHARKLEGTERATPASA